MGSDMHMMSDSERKWMDENALYSRTAELKKKHEFVREIGTSSKGFDGASVTYNQISIVDAEALLKFQIAHDRALTRHPFSSYKVRIAGVEVKYKKGEHYIRLDGDADFIKVDLGKLLQMLNNAIYRY